MKLTAFDVETGGKLTEYQLQPYRVRTGEAWLTSYATAGGEPLTSSAFATPTVDQLRAFLIGCIERDERIVGWNTAFDVAWLIALGLREEVFRAKWLDGKLLWKHTTNTSHPAARKYGLKDAVREFYPAHGNYEDGISFMPATPEQWADLLKYNRRDALFTLRLANRFWDELTDAGKRMVILEAESIPLVAEANVEGIVIDPEAARSLDVKLLQESNVAMVHLRMLDGDIKPEVISSPKQLGELLFDKWQLPRLKATNAGAWSTDKEVLTELSLDYPQAKLVHTYREAVGNRTKFVTKPLESLEYNGDGRGRPLANIFSTYTGRMTYSSKQGRGVEERQTGFALHQWKRAKEFRQEIAVPEGYTLLEFDFAGQEFRWMAVESNDPTMLELCAPGEDAHAYMGAKIARGDYRTVQERAHHGDPEAKRHRQFGKVANLSCQYRTSASTLLRVAKVQHKIKLTEVEAIAIHATYRTTYKAVPEYWRRQIYRLRRDRVITNIAGRQLLFRDDLALLFGWTDESSAINFPIQSAGADQKYLALAVLKSRLPDYDGRFYFELHDGLFVIVPDKHAPRAVREIKHLLSNLPYKKAWGVDLPIQFPVDAKMGKSWGDLEVVDD